MSVRGVSDLERGLRRVPHPATLARLADALQLSADQRARLLAVRSETGSKSTRAPPPRKEGPERELSSFVGRQREVAEVVALLARAPLVTLAGPGGAGKTRLSRHVAQAIESDRVVVVELAPIGDPHLVPR